MKDTLQLKILPTWINVGDEPAPRHLTYSYLSYLTYRHLTFVASFSFSQTNLVFVIRIIFVAIYLLFYA